MFSIWILSILAVSSAETNVSEAFLTSEIVPDILSTPPSQILGVKFNSGVQADLGNVLTPTQVKDEPELQWNAEPSSLYTLIESNPDAPSREDPAFGEFQHWIVVNIPGNKTASGDVLTEYIGAGPSPDTGLHRYVFLIYKQNSKIEHPQQEHLSNRQAARGGFKSIDFVQKHDLGAAEFGNFFQAEYDDYVPILSDQLDQ